MIASRRAHGARQNIDLNEVPARKNEGNLAWLERVKADGNLILIGGASPGHFRMRVAQSHVRRDFLPSFWSMAGLVLRPGRVWTVPVEDIGDAGNVTGDNAVVEVPIRKFDDPTKWPNIATLRFASEITTALVDSVRHDRGIVDLPALLLKWLSFVWGADTSGNPLLAGHGIPSAAFVESVHSLARVDLTPGMSAASSCPEAIWQSAKWWCEFYESRTPDGEAATGVATMMPHGKFTLRQMAAAAIG